VQATAGVSWKRGSGWTDSFDLASGNEIKGKFTYFTKPTNFRIEGSLFAGGYVGLDVGSDVLQTFRLVKPLSILEASAGLKAELKLGGVQTQIDDAGYASKYELKAVLEIGLGKSTADAVKAALKKLTISEIYPDGEDNRIGFKTGVTLEAPLTRSPFGSATVDKNTAAQGAKVRFAVNLDEKDVYLRPLPLLALYNVAEVVIYRSLDGGEASPIKTFSASEGQRNFDWEWTTATTDVGENRFWVLVTPKVLLENIPLEISDNSLLKVRVTCFPAKTLGSQQEQTCKDRWVGTTTRNDNDLWPAAEVTINTSIAFEQPVYKDGFATYKAVGSGKITVGASKFPGCNVSISPTTFEVGKVQGQSVGYLRVNQNVDPAQYDMQGQVAQFFNIIVGCPDGNFDLSGNYSLPFLGGAVGKVMEQTSISGSRTQGNSTERWSFSR
jgi:hypothetical protein